MTLTEQQTKRANELLDLLCEAGDLSGEQAYSLFDSKNDTEYVCSVLEKEGLLSILRVDGNVIDILSSNENTCNAVATNLLDKELISQTKLDSKEQLETKIAMLTERNLILQNKQLRSKMWYSIFGFIVGVIATNWKEILILLKLISPPETK